MAAAFSGGAVVTDDGDIHIPGMPVDAVQKPCRVSATFIGIFYGGDNVGSDWRFQASADGGTWLSGPVSLAWRNWLPVGRRLLDETRTGACGLLQQVTLFVRAREVDLGLFDDLGDRVEFVAIACAAQPARRQVSVPVIVPEYLGQWWRPVLRLPVRRAVLSCIFQIEAQCV